MNFNLWFKLPLVGVLMVLILAPIYRHSRIEKQLGPSPAIRADQLKIFIPKEVLLRNQSRKTRRRIAFSRDIRWEEIAEWVVNSQGSDSPAYYGVLLKNVGNLYINRYLVGFQERQLLDFIRRCGVVVKLRDSVK